jgi:hypothetical protein
VKEKLGLPVLLMLVLALTRWPGLLPPNFSAVYGLFFCAGVYFPRHFAWWLPLGTMLVTDVLLNVLYYDRSVFTPYVLVNYALYPLLIWLGRRFSARAAWWKLVGGGLLGATLFYLLSNTASWLQDAGYAKSLAGWIQALTSGLPGYPPTWEFFRNTLSSGGLFTGLFVGAMKFSESTEEAEETDEAEESGEPEEADQPEEAKA